MPRGMLQMIFRHIPGLFLTGWALRSCWPSCPPGRWNLHREVIPMIRTEYIWMQESDANDDQAMNCSAGSPLILFIQCHPLSTRVVRITVLAIRTTLVDRGWHTKVGTFFMSSGHGLRCETLHHLIPRHRVHVHDNMFPVRSVWQGLGRTSQTSGNRGMTKQNWSNLTPVFPQGSLMSVRGSKFSHNCTSLLSEGGSRSSWKPRFVVVSTRQSTVKAQTNPSPKNHLEIQHHHEEN